MTLVSLQIAGRVLRNRCSPVGLVGVRDNRPNPSGLVVDSSRPSPRASVVAGLPIRVYAYSSNWSWPSRDVHAAS